VQRSATNLPEKRRRVSFPEQLRNGLIVSCQAADGDPLDDTGTLSRIAASVLRGGACGLRAEGVLHTRAFRSLTDKPIIAMKKHYAGNQVFITPDFASARAVAEAGASILAVDCTGREAVFREPWQSIVRRVHEELGLPVMADISTEEEAMLAIDGGVDAVATTLAGYTPSSLALVGIAWDLLAALVEKSSVPVILEGRVESPEDARRALDLGAYAVVVGAAITKPQNITARFAAAMSG
jgi:N-acylglucosamine-6-phosphate 2-epimerase